MKNQKINTNSSLIFTPIRYANELLEREYHQHSLWYFISFIYGIASFFAAHFYPDISRVIAIIILATLLAFAIRNRFFLGSFILLLIASFCTGILISELRMRSISTTTLDLPIKGNITATIIDAEPARDGYHIKVSDITINDTEFPELIARIKASSNNLPQIDNILSEDQFQGKVSLFPLQGAILPGGYEFGLFQYMNGIGASGFASGEIEISQQDHHHLWYRLDSSIFLIRSHIHKYIIDTLGPQSGNFVSAILIGITSGIDKSLADAMRGSGIAHILSVSGLHLSLIAMIFFFTTRVLLNLSNYAAYNWNIKIIASCVAIIASFLYLLLTGSKIAATRAFIMTSIFIVAHMIGRMPYALRSLFIAAFLILIFRPEYVMHPSFQLSFAAVLCLVSGYETYLKNQHLFGINNSAIANIKFYFLANIYTSILAGFATAPFVIYHFFNVPSYGIIMNLLAVPLMSFVIMPLGSVMLIFYGTGLEGYILPVIGFFVDIIIDSAKAIITLPESVIYFGYISKLSLAVFSLGFFWLSVWQTIIRHLGWLLIIISIFLMFIAPKPSFIYDTRYHALVMQKNDGQLIFYTKGRLPDFTKDYILNWYGKPKHEVVPMANRREGNRLFSKLATVDEMQGNFRAQNHSVVNLREDSSTKLTQQFASEVEFRKKSNIERRFEDNLYQLDDGRTIYSINSKSMGYWVKNKAKRGEIKPDDIIIYQADGLALIDGINNYIPFAKYNNARTILAYCKNRQCSFEYNPKDILNFK